MFNRIHRKLGTAGFIISIVALVAALGGGAYAAKAGLSGKQKKEVEKIAKKYAGKPGAAGPAGPAGTAGKDGGNGSNGASGEKGADGTGVTTSPISTGSATCSHNGGVEVKSAGPVQNVCNGADGQTGFTEFLPEGKTETGTWTSGIITADQIKEAGNISILVPISFPIPLEAPITGSGCSLSPTHPYRTQSPTCHIRLITEAMQGEENGGGAGEACEGFTGSELTACEAEAEIQEERCPGSISAPLAQPGQLCVYQGETRTEEIEASERIFAKLPNTPYSAAAGTTVAGAAMTVTYFGNEEEGTGRLEGTWAVTGAEA